MLNNAVRYYSRKQIDDVRNNRNLKYFAQNQLRIKSHINYRLPQAIIYQLSVETATYRFKKNLV